MADPMRSLFVTVRGDFQRFEDADPGAVVVRTLRPAEIVGLRCCGEPEHLASLGEARVYKTTGGITRAVAKRLPGVIRVRSSELKWYNGEGGTVAVTLC